MCNNKRRFTDKECCFLLHVFVAVVVVGVVSSISTRVNLFFSENPIMSIETSSYNLLENSNHFFAIVGAERCRVVPSGDAAAVVERRHSLVLARFSRLL